MSSARIYYVINETDDNEFMSIDYWTSKDLKNEIVELYLMRYKKVNKKAAIPSEAQEEEERMQTEFKATLRFYMKRFKTFMIFDKIKAKDKDGNSIERYGVIAAITVETKAEIGWDCDIHTFIHFIAVRPKYELDSHLKYLLYHVIKQTNMQATTVNYVTKVQGYKYHQENGNLPKPRSIFLDSGFVTRENKAVSDLLHVNSHFIQGHGAALFNKVNTGIPDDLIQTKNVRFGQINTINKFKCRYIRSTMTSEPRLQYYTYTMGWINGLEKDAPNTSKACLTEARNNVGKEIKLEGGGRRNNTVANLPYGAALFKNDENFLQDKYTIDGSNCTWLSAAMLVNINDPDTALKMTNMLAGNVNKFEFMMMKKKSKHQREYADGREIPVLSDYLSRYFRHQLSKVTRYNRTESYLKFILNENVKEGYYICQLSSPSGRQSHIIGVDKYNNHIYDCMETHVIDLTQNNLDYCGGEEDGGVDCIVHCMKLSKRGTTPYIY